MALIGWMTFVSDQEDRVAGFEQDLPVFTMTYKMSSGRSAMPSC